jgi:hypothetical protein
MTESDIEGRRQAWLKMLHLCLAELGVDDQSRLYITELAERADTRRQMEVRRVVHRVVGDKWYLDLYGPYDCVCVTVPMHSIDMPDFLGMIITYIPDGPAHGRLVDHFVEPPR